MSCVPGQLPLCALETGTARCLQGWDAPWVSALPVSSQAGAVIPRLHLWAPGCPRPDLAAACRECTREAPLWNQAISSKLLAEAAWLCCLRWPGSHLTQFLLFFQLGVGYLMALGLSPNVSYRSLPHTHSLTRSDTHRESVTHLQ